MDLKWPINPLSDGHVVTKHGEIIGTWEEDEEGRPFYFTPNGADEPVLSSAMFPLFCSEIEAWRLKNNV